MEAMKRVFLGFFLFFLVFLLGFHPVGAEGAFSDDKEAVVLEKNEVVDRDYFAGGEEVKILGVVNGDLYVGGGLVVINGKVSGDVIVGGGKVEINGEVTQDVRVVGGDLVVKGKIGGNLTAVGANVVVNDSAQLAGSVVAVGGNVTIEAPVPGDVVAGAGSLVINSEVGGNVTAALGELRLESEAGVGGNLTYWSENEAKIDEGVVIAGVVEQKMPSVKKPEEGAIGVLRQGVWGARLYGLISKQKTLAGAGGWFSRFIYHPLSFYLFVDNCLGRSLGPHPFGGLSSSYLFIKTGGSFLGWQDLARSGGE